MAKDDKQKVYDTAMGKVGQSEGEYNKLYDKIGGRGDETWNRGSQDYAGAYKGYSDYAGGGGLTPEDIERMRGAWNAVDAAGGGGGGASNSIAGKDSAYKNLSSAYANAYRPNYAEADRGFKRFSEASGGFDESQLGQLYGNIGNLTEIGKTGGITQEDKDNILRKSMLEQEQTGGYSDQDKALVRAKSAASSPAYFAALKDNLERQRSQTGNLANAGAVDFKLARQSAQQQAQDRMASEMELQESVRGGKERAAQLLSGKGLELAGLRTQNQMTGARSAGDLGLATQMGLTSNQLAGLRGLQESQTGYGQWGLAQAGGLDQFGLNRAGGLDQWDVNQAQLNMAAGSSNASAARANARDKALFEQYITEYGNEQKQYGIGGLTDLYKTNLGASRDFTGMGLDALNSKYGTQGQMLGLAAQNRGNTGMENARNIAGMVGSGAGILTGLGGKTKPGGNIPTSSPGGTYRPDNGGFGGNNNPGGYPPSGTWGDGQFDPEDQSGRDPNRPPSGYGPNPDNPYNRPTSPWDNPFIDYGEGYNGWGTGPRDDFGVNGPRDGGSGGMMPPGWTEEDYYNQFPF